MWTNVPECVPTEWRRSGAEALADAVGYGMKPGPGPAAAEPFRDAYHWYDKKTDVKCTLSFVAAHTNASNLAALIRASGVASGQLDALQTDTPLVCGLVLYAHAAPPHSNARARAQRRAHAPR